MMANKWLIPHFPKRWVYVHQIAGRQRHATGVDVMHPSGPDRRDLRVKKQWGYQHLLTIFLAY